MSLYEVKCDLLFRTHLPGLLEVFAAEQKTVGFLIIKALRRQICG